MIYFNDGIKEKLQKIKGSDFYILSDYDQTITGGVSSWELPSHLESSSVEFKEHCVEVGARFLTMLREYNQTGDFALREKITGWWYELLAEFVDNKVDLSEMKEAVLNDGIVVVRDGTKEFFEMLNKCGVPIVILSAGFVAVIETTLLREGCLLDNVEVFANIIETDSDNKITGVKGEMIHLFNKAEENLRTKTLEKIKDKANVILLGDQIADVEMLPEHKRESAVKIAFRSSRASLQPEGYLKYFDIVCDEKTSFVELMEELKNKYDFVFGGTV